MKRITLMLAVTAMSLAAADARTTAFSDAPPVTEPYRGATAPNRRKSSAARALRTFDGFPSDRKSKGQKKRDAHNRKKNGWTR